MRVKLRQASDTAAVPIRRLRTRLSFLDDLTGGGFVRGAVYMLHGEPGSGKSTLLAQAAKSISGSAYLSSEESEQQVGHRFIRLGCPDQWLASGDDIHELLSAAEGSPFVAVDSVSTMKPGILASGEECVAFARRTAAVVVMICHETKDGAHAGPRQLEHLIDCSMKLRRQPRTLTMEKNRFGPAPVAWELTMDEGGLR